MLPGNLSCGDNGGQAQGEVQAVTPDGGWLVGRSSANGGFEASRARPARHRTSLEGDLAPGLLDESTGPPTWRSEGDGGVNVAGLIVLLRTAVELQAIDCGP